MAPWSKWLTVIAASSLLLVSGESAAAAQIRYHYAPADLCGSTVLKPGGPCGTAGTRVTWFGLVREAHNCPPPRATHVVTFRHPYTGRNVNVPLTFPLGTPRIAYRADRVIFNYGGYVVEARFLPDGSVDAVYNTGSIGLFDMTRYEF
jgi:hypothetical protein